MTAMMHFLMGLQTIADHMGVSTATLAAKSVIEPLKAACESGAIKTMPTEVITHALGNTFTASTDRALAKQIYDGPKITKSGQAMFSGHFDRVPGAEVVSLLKQGKYAEAERVWCTFHAEASQFGYGAGRQTIMSRGPLASLFTMFWTWQNNNLSFTNQAWKTGFRDSLRALSKGDFTPSVHTQALRTLQMWGFWACAAGLMAMLGAPATKLPNYFFSGPQPGPLDGGPFGQLFKNVFDWIHGAQQKAAVDLLGTVEEQNEVERHLREVQGKLKKQAILLADVIL
jgi:hypothetical protein